MTRNREAARCNQTLGRILLGLLAELSPIGLCCPRGMVNAAGALERRVAVTARQLVLSLPTPAK